MSRKSEKYLFIYILHRVPARKRKSSCKDCMGSHQTGDDDEKVDALNTAWQIISVRQVT